MAAPEGGHRAKIPGWVVRDVELRLHRPLATRERDERFANGLVRLDRRHGPLDRPAVEEERHAASVVG